MPGMWRGQNLFTSILMLSFNVIIIIFAALLFLAPQYLTYGFVGVAIYFAAFFYAKTTILLKKREMIDGVLWLDSWTIRDLDYSEEMLWGIEHAKLLDYRIGAENKNLDDYIAEAQKYLYKEEPIKNEDKDKKDETKEEKEVRKKKEADEKGKRKPIITDKEKEVIELAKTQDKESLRGKYFYLVKLSQETCFEDTEEHTFKKAIFITQFPFWIEFNPDRLELEVEGYFAKGRAAKTALNIEAWLTDDRPLVTVAWTEASTLEIKSKLEKPINVDEERETLTKNTITGLRSLVDHYEAKTERLSITEEKWKKRATGFQELYEESEQWWEYVKDDYFNANSYDKKKVFTLKKSNGIILLVSFVVLLGLVIGFFMN